MFAVVYAARAVGPAILDPDVGINFAMMVHAGQEFVWGPVVVGGDEVTTTATVKDISDRGGMAFYVFESVSENQRGERVCTGTWTQVVRGTVREASGEVAIVAAEAEQSGNRIIRNAVAEIAV